MENFIISMILHVLNKQDVEHNYMAGAQLEGFECMVKLSNNLKLLLLRVMNTYLPIADLNFICISQILL